MEELRIRGTLKTSIRTSNDERGSFDSLLPEAFHRDGIVVRQLCRSRTEKAGTIRGIHLQLPPFAEMKFVFCVKGSVFDVMLDLRRESETFKEIQTVELSEHSGFGLVIPPGVAHGFQSLKDETEMLYLMDSSYDPGSSTGVYPLDCALQISWPLNPKNLSERDMALPLFEDYLLKHGGSS